MPVPSLIFDCDYLNSFPEECIEEDSDEYDELWNPNPAHINVMSRARHWCFTLNNYDDDAVARLRREAANVDYMLFGREVGETGTPHLQGFVSFAGRRRLTQIIAQLGQAHFTVARRVPESIVYCKKDGDFEEFGQAPVAGGTRNDLEDFKTAVKTGELDMKNLRETHSDVFARYTRFCLAYVNDNMPTKEVPVHPLREWQQLLNADLNLVADDRKITFLVDYVGNTGKSWFAHYYDQLHENVQVMLPGKKADMAYALDTRIRVLFVDCPRSKQGEFIQYDFLEDCKNGYIFSTKYESRVKSLGKLHVVVSMNEEPDMTKLSPDRYDIRYITNDD